jgi:hypothetical protein
MDGKLRKEATERQDSQAAMLHTRNNPRFFKGTVVEQAVAEQLSLERPSPAATT